MNTIADDQYLFFCTNAENERYLKAEIACFYPELVVSFSSKRFITFKNKGIHYNLKSISEVKLAFATRVGIFCTKADKSNYQEIVREVATQHKLEDFNLHEFSLDGELSKSEDNDSKNIINAIFLSQNQIWIGIHTQDQFTAIYPNSNPSVQLPASSPSRAYLKLKELSLNYNLKFNANCIDFGCAPGGSTFNLLEQGASVWGVDPAKVDDIVYKHPKFKYIQNSIQNLTQEELPKIDIDWIFVDVNLNPKLAIKEVLRLAKMYNRNIKGIIFNISMNKIEHIGQIESYEDTLYEWGFNTVFRCQIPSHKREFSIIAL